MSKCTSCGYLNKENVSFCVSCGSSMDEIPVENSSKSKQRSGNKSSTNKKTFFGLTIIIILAIALFTGYQLLAKKYSSDVIKEQFRTALVEEDRASLKELIQADDARVEVDDTALDALFALVASEPSIIQKIMQDLDSEHGRGVFYIEQVGKHYGLFDEYVIGTRGYFLLLSDTADSETTFYLNDTEIGKLKETEDYIEAGPYLVGSYLIKAISGVKSKQMEDMETVKLTGSETKISIDFDTAPEEIEEEEFIREVHRITMNTDTYIIPESQTVYLDRDDISHLTYAELRLARNEIFARHGYIFESKQLQNYFNQMTWYSPDPYYTGSITAIEEHNVNLIKSLE